MSVKAAGKFSRLERLDNRPGMTRRQLSIGDLFCRMSNNSSLAFLFSKINEKSGHFWE